MATVSTSRSVRSENFSMACLDFKLAQVHSAGCGA
jgi:hypothetical protein